ncbi:DNA primase [Ralstonia thomasii]|uniref:DNA primase n=2 Tax=Pseudomonadota TaxID=1224 RepID=A0AAD2F5G3_9RALS|nr:MULTISPECIES: toprim domain-containing protein [Ralstonia]CAJ0804492.1 DNA primase [Ralstonia sp. LMG 18095]
MVDLPELVQEQGFALRKQGRTWGGASCPSCGEGQETSNRLCVYVGDGGKWRFKCHACGIRGDAADFLAVSRGISLRAALKEVQSRTGVVQSQPSKAPRREAGPAPIDDGAKAQAINVIVDKLLDSQEGKRDAQAYFRRRGISSKVFQEAWGRGIIRSLPSQSPIATRWLREQIGSIHLMASGLLRQGAACPAAAFRPIVGILPKKSGVEFRLNHEADRTEVKALRYGRLVYPWWWRPNGEMHRLIVVEGYIDMLSLVEQGQDKDTAIMALPGANSWRLPWFETLKQRNPNLEVLVALDADDAGDRTAATMIEAVAGVGLKTQRLRPEKGKDWNEALLAA